MAANILIVEDENAILELIALNLHQSGFNPLRAISAEIADSLVKNTLPGFNSFRLDVARYGWHYFC
jgi:two-component system phosphate regulon response regulator PhoB